MSYDIILKSDSGEAVGCVNITWNLKEALDFVFNDQGGHKYWRDSIEEHQCTYTEEEVTRLLLRVIKHRKHLDTLMPPNGWGSYWNILRLMHRMLEVSADYGKVELEVCT